MRKHQVVLLIALLLFCSQNIKAQDHSELFIATNGELPSINLSNSNNLAQQYNFILGYSFPKNVELFMNMGLGMFGENNDKLSFISKNTILGVGANYLHPVNSDYKLGFELMAAYGYSGIKDNINHDHAIYQGCIKAQTSQPFCNMINFYGLVGLRYRSFYHYSSFGGLELYSGIGMRFGLYKNQTK